MSATAAYDTKSIKFLGDGFPSKGKLIGMEDLSIDRDEKVCLESMFKLKAVARARGEHKQRIQLNLTIDAVKVYDDLTKVQLVTHEVERISFVVMDPSDGRAFGYIYNTTDDRHQFWAIKTERPAAFTVIALKELFEAAFEKVTNENNAKTPVQQTASPVALPQSPPPVTIQQPTSETTSIPTLLPPPVLPPRPAAQPTQASITPSFDSIWGDAPLKTVPQPSQQQPPAPNIDLWGMDQSTTPVVQPKPRVEDSLDDLFNFNAPSLPSTTQQPTSTVNSNDLFSMLTPPATTSTFNTNALLLPPPPSTTQQSTSTVGSNDLFSMLTPPATTSTFNTNAFLQPTQQLPVAPPKPTNKSSEFDLLGDFA